MGILDALTGDAGKAAAEFSRNYLGTAQNNLVNATGATKNANEGLLTTGFGNAANNLGTGYGAATGAINTGANSALGYLDQGAQGAVGALQAGGGAYQPLSDLAARAGRGAEQYANSLGLNGAAGNQAAVDAFQAGPGYEWRVDQGVNSLARLANAGGMLNSGNTLRDTLKFGQGLADQEYSAWQDRLRGLGDQELSATAAAAAGNQGNNQAVAGILNSAGQNKAGVATGQGSSLADIARSYYGGLAGLDTAGAGALAGNNSDALGKTIGIGLNLAPQVTKTYADEAKAATDASGNVINLGVNLAKLAAGGLGGLSSGGSSFLPSSSFMNNSWGY